MNILQLTIKNLEEERMELMFNKEYNSSQMERCDRLIDYYLTLYTRILQTINEKRDSIDSYQLILDIKEKLQSPDWLERFHFISDDYLSSVIDDLYELIDELICESDELREKLCDVQREKRIMEIENIELDQRLELIEMSIEDRMVDNSAKQKRIGR